MANLVLMPKLGFNMETGQIVQWHKKEGELINKGDVLVEISTDKTVMEIESTCDGTVRKLLAPEGETVPVILPIAIIGEADENIEQILKQAMAQLGMEQMPDSAQAETSDASNIAVQAPIEETQVPTSVITELKLTPKARKVIAENNLDIANLGIQGTGFQGGITAKDIEKYLENNHYKITPLADKIAQENKVNVANLQGTGIGGKITKDDVLNILNKDIDSKKVETQVQTDPSDERAVRQKVSYSGMRKIIGDRLSQSKFTAPHLYFTTSVDVSNLMDLRAQVNSAQETKVSINDFIIGALIKALQEYPELNSSLQGNEIIQYEDVNIGVAIGLESGLIVPVIRKAQNKKLTQIAQESQSLAGKARNGKLLPHEYQGGTFTISNLGMFGIENFTAIINPPEAGILSISAAKKTPVVVEENGEDKVVIKPILKMTLSVDHRIIDGMTATRFINKVKDLIEKPFSIIV
ncbi:MAG: hypothetical protein APF84_10925 [Gracilibacter sp. BRH_c7a]|nr:MAG: hypothetical protein APF84_10925 [Gracilibacter sp. BRH_c7a]